VPAAPEIRLLAEADLDRVAEIERATFSDPWPRRAFAESLANAHVVGLAAAAADGRLLGYGLASLVVDEGEVLNIAVAPEDRGRGVGRALLGAMLDRLRAGGADTAWLEVRRSNAAAIALYQAAGFQPRGLRQSYYVQPREDALTMVMELRSQTA
jgi:ribosomal-protein-alanine N-acetyltransferase